MGYEMFFLGGLRVPNNRLTCMHGQKTLSFSYRHLFFLPHLLNDSQTIRSTNRFSKPLLCMELFCSDWSMSVFVIVSSAGMCTAVTGKRLVLMLQKRHQVGGNMLMFHFGVNMRRLKIRLRTTRFNDSESTLYIERIYLYTRYTFRFNTCPDVFIHLQLCYCMKGIFKNP